MIAKKVAQMPPSQELRKFFDVANEIGDVHLG